LAASEIAVVSEEGHHLQMGAGRYRFVDPLGETRDFVAVNADFTGNIALVIDQAPVLGVVYAPALDERYTGEFGSGAWKEKTGIRTRCSAGGESLYRRMAASRFHGYPDVELFPTANWIDVLVAGISAELWATGQRRGGSIPSPGCQLRMGCRGWTNCAGIRWWLRAGLAHR